ncbi:MAG: hypothetical protein JNL01_06900 [Bdellovibrionales bacterium]|nr:hypothetical protein [Bdellovibrionales bacterium]
MKVQLRISALIAISAVLFTACKEEKKGLDLEPIPASFLGLGEDLPHEQKVLLSQDVNFLKDNDHTPPAEIWIATKGSEKLAAANRKNLIDEAKRLLGVQSFSGAELYQWLQDRIGYVVDQSYDLRDRNNYVFLGPHQFENPSICPGCWDAAPMGFTFNAGGAYVVMSNVGGSFYLTGKMNRRLVGARIPGHGVVPVSSFRTGILRVGPGLFKYEGKDPRSVVNKINRLATLFHEARHSDGNSEHIGFPHAVCPRSYPGFAGTEACEDTLNGSYTIGAVAEQVMTEHCFHSGQCDRGDANYLRADYLDSFRRVLDGTTGELDPKPEGQRQ